MIAGIVSEFNPFHNGHKFLIDEIRKSYSPEVIITAMSPDFTMRGEVSVFSKMDRTLIAIRNGVDLVLEIPTLGTVESADVYASNAIGILSKAGITDLFFGMESGSVEDLLRAARILDSERYMELLKEELKNHQSFHHASKKAVSKIDAEMGKLIELPNFSLAVEYVRVILKSYPHVVPHAIRRADSGYFEMEREGCRIQSATCIRSMMERNEDYLPYVSYGDEFQKVFTKDIYRFLQAEILKSSLEELRMIKGINEGMEYAIKEAVVNPDYDSFVSSLVSKRNREVKIKRIMIYILLGIKKSETYDSPFIRVLGFDGIGRNHLKGLRDSDMIFYSSIRKGLDESCYREIDFSRIRLLLSGNHQTQISSFYSPIRMD